MAEEIFGPSHAWLDYDTDQRPSPELHEGSGASWNFLRQALAARAPSPMTLLDLGTWRGRHIGPLAALVAANAAGGQVLGIDQPAAEAQIAQARMRQPNATFQLAPLEALGLDDASIDGAVIWRVLHHCTKPGSLHAALRELVRVLKPGAPLVVAVRSTEEPSAAAQPVIQRRFQELHEREDLCFPGAAALRTVFGFWFTFAEEPRLVEEGEAFVYAAPERDAAPLVLDYRHAYWVTHLRRKSAPSRDAPVVARSQAAPSPAPTATPVEAPGRVRDEETESFWSRLSAVLEGWSRLWLVRDLPGGEAWREAAAGLRKLVRIAKQPEFWVAVPRPQDPALRLQLVSRFAAVSTGVCLDPRAGSSTRREMIESLLFARRLFSGDPTPAIVRQQFILGHDFETLVAIERRAGGAADLSPELWAPVLEAFREQAARIEAEPVPVHAEPTFDGAQFQQRLAATRLLPLSTKLAILAAVPSMERSTLLSLVELLERWSGVGEYSGDEWLGWYRATRGRAGEWLN